jgi:hypothetical protein
MHDDPGLLASSLSVLRLIGGWALGGLGLLGLSMGIDARPGTTDGPYLLFHAVLLATGAALMTLGALRKRPGPVAYATGAAVAVLGSVLSALPRTTIVCCLRDYPGRHGFPFTVLAGGRHVAPCALAADLVFWACAGFLALLLATLLRPGRRPAPEQPPPAHNTHAEQRAPAAGEPAPAAGERTPAVTDENVGGLP